MYEKLKSYELIILNVVSLVLVITSILAFLKLKKEIEKLGDM